jgi:glycosyltransferase involved in cell wall biosynthesis
MISAVILTRNNAKEISRTLSSVSFCKEIIVVDDFSTDKTVSVCHKYNAKAYKRHLAGDFAGQRNFGLDKAQSPWVLFVDSDEVVPGELACEIKRVTRYAKPAGPASPKAMPTARRQELRGKREEIQGYYIKRVDYFLGKELKYGETGDIRLVRLAKKGAGLWSRPVHEVWDVKGKVGMLKSPLLHHSHSDVAQFIQDLNQYSTISSRYLFSCKKKSSVFTILGYPGVKFIQNYFLRLGFLDGTRGMLMAGLMSFHSFLTRAKLYILTHAPA